MNMTLVHIGNILEFAPNRDIVINPDTALELIRTDPDRLVWAINTAKQHWQDELFVDANCGGIGPLADLGDISLEEYLLRKAEAEWQIQLQAETRKAKKKAIKRRRAAFQAMRDDLVLKMIDAGALYVCAVEGCCVSEDLTVDHRTPLSRGGTDDVSNLQFMCRSHNSSKGNRL